LVFSGESNLTNPPWPKGGIYLAKKVAQKPKGQKDFFPKGGNFFWPIIKNPQILKIFSFWMEEGILGGIRKPIVFFSLPQEKGGFGFGYSGEDVNYNLGGQELSSTNKWPTQWEGLFKGGPFGP